MQTAPATVIDLDAYRSSRKAERAPVAMPVAWVMVWFAPIFVVQPFPVQPLPAATAR